MSSPDSAARRLHSLLVQAVAQPVNQPIIAAWRAVLGREKSTVDVYRSLAAAADLARKAEEEVRSIPGINHDTYLKHLPVIRRVLDLTNLDESWQTVRALLAPEVVSSIDYCAERVSESVHWQQMEESELKELTHELAELFEWIGQADIAGDLKKTLLRLLEVMRRAIAEYRIGGPEGLRDAVAAAIGGLFMNRSQVQPKDVSLVQKVWAFAVKLGSASGAAMKYAPALKVASRFYLPEGAADVVDEVLPGK